MKRLMDRKWLHRRPRGKENGYVGKNESHTPQSDGHLPSKVLQDSRQGPPYVYHPLEHGIIRIFKFQTNTKNDNDEAGRIYGTLRTIPLGDISHEPYIALSYSWGSPFPPIPPWDKITWKTQDITCDGRSLSVLGNLYDALQVLHQQFPTKAFWIDALCINQEDEIERNEQVRIMGEIYENAVQTIVWLGREVPSSNTAMFLINEFATACHDHDENVRELAPCKFNDPELFYNIGLSLFSQSDWEAIIELYSRTWFQRLWVAQEAALARQLDFMCGHITISATAVCNFADYLILLNWDRAGIVRRRPNRKVHQSSGIFIASKIAVLRELVASGGLGEDGNWAIHIGLQSPFKFTTTSQFNTALLGTLILNSAPRLCSDSRDKIFAPLALATRLLRLSPSETKLPIPDYGRHIGEICFDTSIFFLKSGYGLELLSLVERPITGGVGFHIPSWVVNFSGIRRTCQLASLGHQATKSWIPGGNSIEGSLLKVEGIQFDTIIQCTPPGSMQVTDVAAMLECCSPLEPINHLGQTPIDVLIHLLCQDPSEKSQMSNPGYISAIKHWVTFFLIQNIVRISYHAKIPYDFLEKYGDSPYLPSATDIEEFRPQYTECCHESRYPDWDKYMIAPMDLVHPHFHRLLFERSILRTGKNNLALSHGTTRVGDEIWFLRGGDVPFVLRPLPNGRYEFVGEAYLHGYMQGEIFECGGKSIGDAVTISIE